MGHPPIANPWLPYGLSSDPFFQEPLSPEEADPAAADPLFVGRDEEVRLLGAQILGSRSSRAVVQGGPGVGKTSVVNRLKAAVAAQQVLSHALPIRVTEGLTPRGFCAEVLRVLALIRATVELPEDDAAFWRRVGRLVRGEDVVGFGITAGPAGLNREPGRIPAELADLSLDDELARAFMLLGQGGNNRVLVHVNNLENISPDAAAEAGKLLQNVRDVFLLPHSHWVFVGALDLEQAVFRRRPQLGGILPLAITLEPLTGTEVVELLARRYVHLAIQDAVVPPVAPDAVMPLYHRYGGDLRNFLRLLSQAAQRRVPIAPVAPMSAADVIQLMAPSYYESLRLRLGPIDLEHLRRVATHVGPHELLRMTELRAATGLTKSGASEALQRLVRGGVLVPARRDTKSVWYRLSGEATIALAQP